MDRRGLTLIELLLVVILAATVIGVVSLVFRNSLDAWRVGESEVSLQREAQKIMEEMIEGGDRIPAIREALEVVEATETSFGFVPFWIDYSNDYRKESNEFILSKKVKAGSSVPIGQIKAPGAKQFSSVPTIFIYNKEKGPNSHEDKVRFINPIPVGSDVRILFHPDSSLEDNVIMRYFWDDKSKRIFRTYKGETNDVMKYAKKIKVVGLKLLYYDNLNHRLEAFYSAQPGDSVSSARASAIPLSAIGIEVTLEDGSIKRELSSFVSIRTLGGNLGSGIILGEGSEVSIPDSRHIRTLVLDNLGGIGDNDTMELEISSVLSSTWKISVNFGIVNNEPYILGFEVEYPKGTVVYSNDHKRPANSGLNLLRLGNDYYDYDDDIHAEDVVRIEGNVVKLKVEKMNIGAAALFVRP
ncbi:MAG: hypothetical protein Q8L26_07525 [Candidatus Omnitrophota bacterium]|nr:hypothetical protein [Candidatus Omnitrophota bacterium]